MTKSEHAIRSAEPVLPDFEPIKIFEIEISQPIQHVTADRSTVASTYRKGLALVRLHSVPLGVIKIHFEERGVGPEALAALIWDHLGDAINAHLRQDGLPEVTALGPDGLPVSGDTACVSGRRQVLRNAPFVSIVIATRNRARMLAPTLDSLLALDYPNFEILVLDNAPSNSETADLIAQRYGLSGRIRYVREDRPGLGVAHNRALKELVAPIVAFTDDDVVVDAHWLTALVRGFEAGPRVGCVTGLVLPAEVETPAQVLFEQFVGFGKGFAQRIFDLNENRDKSRLYPYSAGWFGTGASMAFKTAVLRELGGFAPDLGTGTQALGGDDLDGFFRVIAGGYQLVYQPSSIAWHYHRRDYAALRKQAYGYGAGLTAFLVKTIKDRPMRFFDIALKTPLGLYYMLRARGPKIIQRSPSFPKELLAIERRGMLYGPIAYLKSYRNHRRLVRAATPHVPASRSEVEPAAGKLKG